MMDERTALHRLRATSWAGITGGILLGAWFLYRFHVHGDVRWDLIAIMTAMAVVKLGVTVYYRVTD